MTQRNFFKFCSDGDQVQCSHPCCTSFKFASRARIIVCRVVLNSRAI